MPTPTLRSLAFATALVSTTVVGLTGLAGCGGGDEPKTAKVASGPMPEGEEWNGVYYHSVFGNLHLQEEGSNVVGRWRRADGSYWGELSGTTNGNVFHYTWKEHKIGMVGPSATTHGKGYFVYTKNPDGHGFLKGEYGLNDAEVGSEWTGLKQQNAKPDLKSIGGEGEGLPPGAF